jgi:hypothetical protein
MGKPEDDNTAATKLVLDILKDRQIGEIDFMLGSISIKPTMYQKVSQAIVDKKITVIVEPKALAANEAGKYLSVLTIDKDTEFYDVLILGTPDRGKSVNEQFHKARAIVHECTHAGLDLLKVPNMTHTQHEACAYVADSIFAMAKMLAVKMDLSNMKITEAIPIAAWEVARLQIKSKAAAGTPSAPYWTSPDFAMIWVGAVNKLNAAISTSDTYKKVAKDKVNNDGVGREWKLPKKQSP